MKNWESLLLAGVIILLVFMLWRSYTSNPSINSKPVIQPIIPASNNQKIPGNYCCPEGSELKNDMCRHFNGQTVYWSWPNICAVTTPIEALNIKINK